MAWVSCASCNEASLLIQMAAQCVSKVELSISCSNLLDKDVGSKSDPLCVLLQSVGDDKWSEVERTERVKNCQDPEFSTKLHVDYHFEKVQKLKFGIYDIDNKSVDLKDDDFLGGFECTLGQIVSSRKITRPLQLKAAKPAGKGTITITADEVKDNRAVVMEVEAKNLDKKDMFGKSDPFLEFFKQEEDGKWQLVHRTEVIKNNLNPSWKKFTVSLHTFCSGDLNKPIKVTCYDKDEDTSSDMIGEFTCTAAKLMEAKDNAVSRTHVCKSSLNISIFLSVCLSVAFCFRFIVLIMIATALTISLVCFKLMCQICRKQLMVPRLSLTAFIQRSKRRKRVIRTPGSSRLSIASLRHSIHFWIM